MRKISQWTKYQHFSRKTEPALLTFLFVTNSSTIWHGVVSGPLCIEGIGAFCINFDFKYHVQIPFLLTTKSLVFHCPQPYRELFALEVGPLLAWPWSPPDTGPALLDGDFTGRDTWATRLEGQGWQSGFQGRRWHPRARALGAAVCPTQLGPAGRPRVSKWEE